MFRTSVLDGTERDRSNQDEISPQTFFGLPVSYICVMFKWRKDSGVSMMCVKKRLSHSSHESFNGITRCGNHNRPQGQCPLARELTTAKSGLAVASAALPCLGAWMTFSLTS